MKTTVSCTQCDKSFTHSSKAKAAQALAMHIGRKHKKNIVAHHEHSGVLRQHPNGDLVAVKHPRSNLKGEEVGAILTFIRNRQSEFSNKTACLKAALGAAGAAGKIIPTSTTVNRYFAKAAEIKDTGLAPAPLKRKYTKRTEAPKVAHITVKFCPCCGTNMEAVATGIAMAAHLK